MRLLIDTHVFLALIEPQFTAFGPLTRWLARQHQADVSLSVASLWEIAIKKRLGKLDLNIELSQLPELADRMGIGLIAITARHVLLPLDPEPVTRDPFDRLLLAQCSAENLRLLTADRALINHPLAVAESS
jgi:PIN domain nuclease of toxin-antitoxin system